MTRDEYLMQKQTGQLDLNACYEFYVNADSTNNKLTFEQFTQFFPVYLANQGTVSKYHLYYDKKFGLISRNQNGDILI